MADSKGTTTSISKPQSLEDEDILSDEAHPDFVAGSASEDTFEPQTDDGDEGAYEGYTPAPGAPIPERFPFPGRIPTIPNPFPHPIPIPSFCGAVSGKYHYSPFFVSPPLPARPIQDSAGRPVVPRRVPGPFFPINMMSITVRVDVDRFFPQQRISVEVTRLFPRRTAHVIAEVTSDTCRWFNRRTVKANIVYRDGDASLIPGNTITFKARPSVGFGYGRYDLVLSGGISRRTYPLTFQSRYFDPVEFEVDQVANAGGALTTYNTASHPNRPANLPNETLSLATVYKRAGFDVKMSPNSNIIPTSGAGANGTWSDAEMHNAMVTYWSRFSNRPNWAMWVLYAARHDMGRSLGGIMFDDIGPNHRQGTAIFNDSFIQDVPAGTPNPAAWRNRMTFWTAVHEMGHGFNLAHAWQKALGNPWIPISNDPESRSFMNYPFRVAGGESTFFSDFRFRFSDEELTFMRHAPRRFVQMGNSNWFENHGFEAPNELEHTGRWAFKIRPNRDGSSYRFLEPVTMELKLTNTSDSEVSVNENLLADGQNMTVFIQREGGQTKQWRPMVSRFAQDPAEVLSVGESLYGNQLISATTDGWTIDEPGFYKVQAAINMGDEIVVSNIMRLYITPPASAEEGSLAADFFTEDVARVIRFGGAPVLDNAHAVLERVSKTCADNPASIHARIALALPKLRNFKVLEAGSGRDGLAIKTRNASVSTASKELVKTLLKDSDAAADTLGHIPYFQNLRDIAEAMEDHGDEKGAIDLMSKTIGVMKHRHILGTVIDLANRRLKRRM